MDLPVPDSPACGEPCGRPEVASDSSPLCTFFGAPFDDKVSAMIRELADWPGPVISSHKSARQYFHKLGFLADIGVKVDEPGMSAVIAKVLAHRDAAGIPSILMAIPVAFGGTGKEMPVWMLCDAPVTLRALAMMGVDESELLPAVDFLAAAVGGRGWGCRGAAELGTWRGPGKKSDPCPYATLIMVRLLSCFGTRYAAELRNGAETLLGLWENSRTEHPYLFYMGDDFRKLKLPLFWYDILHVVDAVSCACDAGLQGIADDPRFLEMWSIIESKRTAPGGFIPESVYMEFKGWDFGQKKTESAWMGHFVGRIRERIARNGQRMPE